MGLRLDLSPFGQLKASSSNSWSAPGLPSAAHSVCNAALIWLANTRFNRLHLLSQRWEPLDTFLSRSTVTTTLFGFFLCGRTFIDESTSRLQAKGIQNRQTSHEDVVDRRLKLVFLDDFFRGVSVSKWGGSIIINRIILARMLWCVSA